MPVARDASLRRQLARAADRGMASIDATINLDGYEAWPVCPQFAAGIAATTPTFNGQLWKLRLFSPYGEPIAYCGLY